MGLNVGGKYGIVYSNGRAGAVMVSDNLGGGRYRVKGPIAEEEIFLNLNQVARVDERAPDEPSATDI